MSNTQLPSRYALLLQNLLVSLEQPLNQMTHFANIGLRRIHRRQTDLTTQYLAEIKTMGEELILFTNDLLEIAQLESGDSELALEEVDLVEFFKGIHDQFLPLAHSCHASLFVNSGAGRPYVMADYNRLYKVLTILLRSRLRTIPKKGLIHIEIHREETTTSVSVQDNGPSVPEEQQANLFRLFDKPAADRGVGLMDFRLSICKELMTRQQGDIQVDPSYSDRITGQGSRFLITLPTAHAFL